MPPQLYVPPLGPKARAADAFMTRYIMPYFTHSGESPQLTHRWNNFWLDSSATDHLLRCHMVFSEGVPGAKPRRIPGDGATGYFLSLLDLAWHLPKLGGWREYVVLEPCTEVGAWYVGWISDRVGVSRVPITRCVRVTRGPNHTWFFGVSVADSRQVPLREVARGRIGDGGWFQKVPLH